MTQQHGRRFENKIVNGIDRVTTDGVWTTAAGYSGGADADACDFVVTVNPQKASNTDVWQLNVEAKKRQGERGKRNSGVFSGSEDGETGKQELQRLVKYTPEWADPVASIKFDHCKLISLDARWILDYLDVIEYEVPASIENLLDVLQPRLTPSESVSMVKPTLDDWPSSRAADDDWIVFCEQMGLPYEVEE